MSKSDNLRKTFGVTDSDQYFVAYPVDDDFLLHNSSYKKEDLIWRFFGEEIKPCIIVKVAEESLADSCNKLFHSESKKDERNCRCLISNDNGGLKRCYASCKNCKNFRTGTPLSLDKNEEDFGDVLSSNYASPEDIVISKEMKTSILKVIENLGEIEAIIGRILIDDPKVKDKELMKATGVKKQSSLSYHKMKVKERITIELEKWL